MARGCEVVSGFLIKHACDYPATARCLACGKRVCAGHSRPLDGIQDAADLPFKAEPGEEAVVCVECVKARAAQNQPVGARAAGDQRDWYRDRYYDDPYFWGMYHHPYYHPYSVYDDYSASDRAAFERDGDMAGGYEGDVAGT